MLVLLPLWASYIARIYSWKLILNSNGVLVWSLHKLGLPAPSLAYTNTGNLDRLLVRLAARS